jgi:hypothetical protein
VAVGGGRCGGGLGSPSRRWRTGCIPSPSALRDRLGDPDGGRLTVTLAVSHGTLTLGKTAGLTVSGNGTASVSLSSSIADLNAALASLAYRGVLNFSGADVLTIGVSDGSLSSSGSVAIKSAAEQAADLKAQVAVLRDTGVLNQGQAQQFPVMDSRSRKYSSL